MTHVAFGLLLAGEAILLAAILIGGAEYPGYDHARQYISELGATGTVTGQRVSWWGFLPSGLLITTFCLVAAWQLRRRPAGAAGAALLAWYAFGLVTSAFFPCDLGCSPAEPSLSQLLHDLAGGSGYLAGAAGVLLVGLSARRSDATWLHPLGVICAFVAFVAFAGLAPDFVYRGLAQRVLESALAGFLLAFGHALRTGALRGEPPGGATRAPAG